VDDDLDLLHGSDGGGGPKRPWALLGGIGAVALLTLVGVVWMVSAVAGRGGSVTLAASPSPTTTAPTTVPAPPPTTAVAAPSDSAFPTALPPTTPPPAPTYSLPPGTVPPAVTVAPAPAPTTTRVRPLPVPTPREPPPGSVTVPNVVGMKVRAATLSLRSAGLQASVLGGVLTPDRDRRRVTLQRPAAGASVRPGATVVLVTDGL
jgi:hypothetical protein